MKLSRTRAAAVLPAALLLLPLLSGCTSSPAQGTGLTAEGCGIPGEVSDSIRVAGDFGTDLQLDSRTAAEAAGSQRSVMLEGDGREIADGLTIVGHMNIFVGSNGEPYAQEASRHVMSTEGMAPWFYEMLSCSQGGDRIASVMPAADVLGEGGGEPTGIADEAALVVVFDLNAVLAAGDGRAVGTEQALPEGFPAVTLAGNGAPTVEAPVTLGSFSEPTSATRIVGAGATVKAGQTVLVHYTNVIARTGEVFGQSWGGDAISIPLDQSFPGTAEAIIGQTVGSQVVVLVPNGGGYLPEELADAGLQEDDVMIYVFDILDAG